MDIINSKPEEELNSSDIEAVYYDIETKLGLWTRLHGESRTSISMQETLNTTQCAHGKELRLPKSIVPMFDGNYMEWQTFYDLFCANIHGRTNLTPGQKFQFLIGYLKGEASNLIKHLQITDANYLEALDKLRCRYNRKKQIINSYITKFLEQEPLQSSNAGGLRRILDTSDEMLRGLRALGNDAEARDPWIIRLLLNKVDGDTKGKWADASKDLEFPSIKDLFEFLQGRIDALDDLKSLQSPAKPNARKVSIRAHVSATMTCPCCKKETHKIAECDSFKQLNVSDRRKLIEHERRCFNCLNINHPVFRCLSKSRCNVCARKHHSLLHTQQPGESSDRDDSEITSPKNQTLQSSVKSTYTKAGGHTILPTAVVKFLTADGQFTGKCRILFDSGSQMSFVSESFVRRYRLPVTQRCCSVTGLGQVDVGKITGSVKLTLLDETAEPVLTVEAFKLSKVTSKLPQFNLNLADRNYLKNIKLADPSFNVSGDIDLLLGVDQFFNVLESGQIRNDQNQVIAQNTKFGWVVAGNLSLEINNHHATCLTSLANIEAYMKAMWETEAVPDRLHLTDEEEACELLYQTTTTKDIDGKFVVRLPFKESPSTLGNSYHHAISRLRAIEKRFVKEPEFKKSYQQFMEQYLELNHMRILLPEELLQHGYYIPHHGVLKTINGQTKIRVVFDASARDSKGKSLNEILRNGPTVQSTLYSILLRFRIYKYVFATDIKKMYRQILIAPADRQWQRIVWRKNVTDPVEHYELITVTYGTKPAPFLATRTIKQIAKENLVEFPLAAFEIDNNMYVDDLMTGGDSINEVLELKRDIQSIFAKYKMNLGKWVSNTKQLLEDIPEADQELSQKDITEHNNMVKVLGLRWDPHKDWFTFTVQLLEKVNHTKRSVLSEASRIFDPLGLISPCIIPIKILLQEMWKVKLEWDDELPIALKEQWIAIRSNLVKLEELTIPRWLNGTTKRIELHGFCDASEHAYGAVVYIRGMYEGKVKVSMLTSKSKVAPVKPLTIPKLELSAAVLLTKLLNIVKESFNSNEITTITAWSDSTIVLDWLSAYPGGKDIFVKNRTALIIDSLSRNCWNHVSSDDNPADIVSRGATPEFLQLSHLWWNGPSWLSEHCSVWPKQVSNNGSSVEVYAVRTQITRDDTWLPKLFKRVSRFEKIVKVVARIKLMAINSKSSKSNRRYELNSSDIHHAENIIFKYIQKECFPEEVKKICSSNEVSHQSGLRNLNPFLDAHQTLRVGGRIKNALIDYNSQHPIILSKKSEIVSKLVEEYHVKYRHAGPTLLNSILKQRFWIIGGRILVRSIFQRCIQCRKAKPLTQQQMMADLPEYRVQFTRPFLKIGIDYAGPFMAYHKRGRGQRPTKIYVCVFVCLSSKAAHFEVAGDLSTNEFLAAWKRMTARRGLCSDVFSDCGSNFIGANRMLKEWYTMLKQNNNLISEFLLREKVNWHFNPPSAPHFGGIWEAAVKSFKTHLRRVVGKNILTISEFTTLVTEIEGILNSRPLCRGDVDVDVLTPAHLLIGHPITSLPEPYLERSDLTYVQRWQLVKQMVQHFWVRWHKEYLVTLQHRYKWQEKYANLKVDDIVMIKDESMGAPRWFYGRVIQTHAGTDGLVRTVTLKTLGGTIQRPIHKLCKLPICESTDSRGARC